MLGFCDIISSKGCDFVEHGNDITALELEIIYFLNKHSQASTDMIKKKFKPKHQDNFDEVDDAIEDLKAYQIITDVGNSSENIWKLTVYGTHVVHSQRIIYFRSFRFQMISFILGLISGVTITVIGGIILSAITNAP